MKNFIMTLLSATLRQRVYFFDCPYEAYAFGVQFDGTVEIKDNHFIVTI
jgi:hypothetical protein